MITVDDHKRRRGERKRSEKTRCHTSIYEQKNMCAKLFRMPKKAEEKCRNNFNVKFGSLQIKSFTHFFLHTCQFKKLIPIDESNYFRHAEFVNVLSAKYLALYRPFSLTEIPTISSECRKQADVFIKSLKKFEFWALKSE